MFTSDESGFFNVPTKKYFCTVPKYIIIYLFICYYYTRAYPFYIMQDTRIYVVELFNAYKNTNSE